MNKPPRNIAFGSPGKGISLGSSADAPSPLSWSVFVMSDWPLVFIGAARVTIIVEGTAASQKKVHS
jgi:hypothetical protein